jgi:hypothetical protein
MLENKVTFMFLYFLPGSAGNFLSRCIGLCNNVYTFVPKGTTILKHLTVEEKYDMFSYKTIIDRELSDTHEKDWIVFENKLVPIVDIFSSDELRDSSNNAVIIDAGHPNADYTRYKHNRLSPDDNMHVFLINISDSFEWMFYNALYKNSGFVLNYFRDYEIIKNFKNTKQIKLSSITDDTRFIKMYISLCKIIGIKEEDIHHEFVRRLYTEWQTTILTKKKMLDYNIPQLK